MIATDLLWILIVYSAIFSALILTAGALTVRFVGQPADRLRLIQCVLVACLAAPCLYALPGRKAVSLNLTSPSRTQEAAVEESRETVPPHHAEQPAAERRDVVSHDGKFSEIKKLDGVQPEQPTAAIAPSVTVSESLAPPVTHTLNAPQSAGISSIGVTTWIVLAYLGAVLTMIVWWMVGLTRRILLERSANVASSELQQLFVSMAGPTSRRVRLLVSNRITGPMTWGLVRPVIIVPSQFANALDTPQIRWSLAHELSHVERCDIGTLLLAAVTQLVCFYQPLYWWLRRQMSLCQDYLADARAAQVAGSAEDYAEFLVRLATSRLQPRLPATLGIIDSKSQLFRRIKMLLGSQGGLPFRCSWTIALGGFMGTAALLGLLSGVRLDADDKAAAQTATNPTAKGQAESQVDETEPEDGVVKGILVNAKDGTPIADATVILHAGGSNKTRSDAQGRFRLDNIPPRTWAYPVWAHQGNLISKKVLVRPLVNQDEKIRKFAPLRLEMSEGQRAKFLVSSEITGKPVAGATVRFGYPDRRLVTTNAQGFAIVPGLLSEKYDVIVDAEGHARDALQLDLSQVEGDTEYKSRLTSGGVIRGTVLDADNKPVVDADVYYRISNGSGFYGDAFRTNAEGAFRHRFLPLNVAVKIEIAKDGYVRQTREATLTLKEREQEVHVKLSKSPTGGSIAGTVVDELGKPVAGVEVANLYFNESRKRQTLTDAQGKFSLHDVPKGQQEDDLYLAAKGFSPQRVEIKLGTADNPGQVQVILLPGHSLRGQVKLEGGAPAKGATVSTRANSYRMGLGKTISVDDDGRFELDSLPSDTRFDVQMSGYAMLHNIPQELDQADPVTITLESPGIIRGRVLDAETRKPLPQFRIRLGVATDRRPDEPWAMYNSEWTNSGLTFTSERGEFLIEPLKKNAPVSLTVEQEGFERTVIDRAVAITAKEQKPVEILLKRADTTRFYTLTGQLVDHDGKPKAGAQLRLIVSTEQPTGSNDNKYNWTLIKTEQLGDKPYCEQYLSGVTKTDGRFEFKNIVPDRYLQLAYWGPGVPTGKSLAFDDSKAGAKDDVTVQLHEPAVIRGTIDRAKFPGAASVRVSPELPGGEHLAIQLTGKQDEFEFNDVPPGTYWVSIDAKPKRFIENGNEFSTTVSLGSQRLELVAGDIKELRFTKPGAMTR